MSLYNVVNVYVILFLLLTQSTAQDHMILPKKGLVPDEKTAITIAVAIWIPIFGEKQIASQKPYVAILKNGKWIVTGTLSQGMRGGTATAIISQMDGRVTQIGHSK